MIFRIKQYFAKTSRTILLNIVIIVKTTAWFIICKLSIDIRILSDGVSAVTSSALNTDADSRGSFVQRFSRFDKI